MLDFCWKKRQFKVEIKTEFRVSGLVVGEGSVG